MALTYEDRKLAGICTYPGCESPCGDESLRCERHASADRSYDAARRAKDKARRRADRACMRCGHPKRKAGSKWCLRCLIQLGRLRADHQKQHQKHAPKFRQVTEGDGRTRNRYIGHGKRGAQSTAANDAQDLVDILKCIEKCRDGLVAVAAEPDLGRIERKAAEHAALSHLHLATRLAGDVFIRHRYETPRRVGTDT